MFKVIRKRTGRINGYYQRQTQRSHRKEIVLFLFFFAGLAVGAIAVRKNSSLLLDRLLSLFENYSVVKAGQSAAVNFSNALFKQIILLLTTFCIGLCAVGLPFLYLLPFGYGTGVGLVSAFLYKTYMLKGIGYCALILYPGVILTVAALVFACSVGARMSRFLMNGLLTKDTSDEENFRQYCLRFLAAAGVAVCAALAETALYAVFSGYFQFS
jgi:hypothetical protein